MGGVRYSRCRFRSFPRAIEVKIIVAVVRRKTNPYSAEIVFGIQFLQLDILYLYRKAATADGLSIDIPFIFV